ncbi:MAG: hypothetical protein KatS3mg111_2117 [Pirellulaceae bacterium]|nr:MAG: hypothetical protein KatS3mg111_2117 [Pirellulaceae bacterium]
MIRPGTLAFVAVIVGSLCLFGCDQQGPDYGKLGLVEVGGIVTLDGAPVAGAGVFFYDEQQRYSYGITDEQGHYQLMFNSEKSGVTPGKKRVEIWTTKNPLGEAASGEVEEEDPDARSHAEEQIPACYNKQTVLTVEVTEADSSLDFPLASDCSTTAAS